MLTREEKLALGARIQEWRRALGHTAESLAEAAAVPVGTLRGYETGRREPGVPHALRIAHALGVTVEALFHGLGAGVAEKI